MAEKSFESLEMKEAEQMEYLKCHMPSDLLFLVTNKINYADAKHIRVVGTK